MPLFSPLRSCALAALALCLSASAGAAADRATTRNGMVVAGDAGRFEVFPGAGAGGPDLFCAAGDFAKRHLGARATDRVQLIGAPAPSLSLPGRRSAVFALRPPDAPRPRGLDTLLLRPRAEGNSRSVAFAAHLCETRDRR